MFPSLKKLQKEEGEAGRRKFQQYQRYGALAFAVVQAVGQCLYVRPYVEDFNLGWLVESSAVLTAGAMILLYIGEVLTELKLGNGTSLLIFTNIISSLPSSFGQTISEASEIKALRKARRKALRFSLANARGASAPDPTKYRNTTAAKLARMAPYIHKIGFDSTEVKLHEADIEIERTREAARKMDDGARLHQDDDDVSIADTAVQEADVPIHDVVLEYDEAGVNGMTIQLGTLPKLCSSGCCTGFAQVLAPSLPSIALARLTSRNAVRISGTYIPATCDSM